MTNSPLLTAILAASASFVGAWLAARFALSRFYREKVWERKTAAYTAIFEALHDMGLWFDEHLNAEELGIELTRDEKARLTAAYQTAKKTLDRRLAAETWLIPKECADRLQVMMRELTYEGEDWIELLEEGASAISRAKKDLTKLVREDLSLDSKIMNLLRSRRSS